MCKLKSSRWLNIKLHEILYRYHSERLLDTKNGFLALDVLSFAVSFLRTSFTRSNTLIWTYNSTANKTSRSFKYFGREMKKLYYESYISVEVFINLLHSKMKFTNLQFETPWKVVTDYIQDYSNDERTLSMVIE